MPDHTLPPMYGQQLIQVSLCRPAPIFVVLVFVQTTKNGKVRLQGTIKIIALAT